jgi:hypothetical protein
MRRNTQAVSLIGVFLAVGLIPVITGRLSADEGDIGGRVWLRASSRTASGTSSSAPSADSPDKPLLRRARSGKCFLGTVTVVPSRAGLPRLQPSDQGSGEEEGARHFARSCSHSLPIKRAPPHRM